MKRPIGLYLAEFRTGAVTPPPLAPALPPACDDGFSTLHRPLPDDVAALPPMVECPHVVEDEVADDPTPPAPPMPTVAEVVAALEADHAAALVAARQRWAETEGAALARHLDTALGRLEERIVDVLAPMLEPLLAKAAQAKAITELRGALLVLLRSGNGQTVAVTGPADLLTALEASHPGEPALVFAIADTPDVTIAAGETLVRSRLRDWTSALEASLGDRA